MSSHLSSHGTVAQPVEHDGSEQGSSELESSEDETKRSAMAFIEELVMEARGQGQFLSGSDYRCIYAWVNRSSDLERLMLWAARVLPPLLTKNRFIRLDQVEYKS